MKPIRAGLILVGAASLAGPLRAQTPPATPPPPPKPEIQMPPGTPPGMNMPRPPAMFRMRAPAGMQARFTYSTITTHKEELGLSEEQAKNVEDVWTKGNAAPDDSVARLRRELDELSDADAPDMAKIETTVRAIEKAEADRTLADIRLNIALKKVLTPAQREQLSTLSPFPTMPSTRPPMPPMPGMAPPPGNGPGMAPMPGMPGMAPAPPRPSPPPPPPSAQPAP